MIPGQEYGNAKLDDDEDQPDVKGDKFSEVFISVGKFHLILVWLLTATLCVTYNQMFAPLFFPTLSNSENFNWKGSEFTIKQSILQSLFFLGLFLACFTFRLFSKFSQRKFYGCCHISVIILALISIIPSEICLFVARFGIGYISGLIMTLASNLIYQFCPPTFRAYGNIWFTIGYAIGQLLVTFWGYADDKKSVWKYAMVFQILPSLITIILTFTYFKKWESPLQLLQANKRNEAEDLMSTYLKEEYVIFT